MEKKKSFPDFMQSLGRVVHPDSGRGYGSFSFSGSDIEAQTDYFNTGGGICYFSKRIRSNNILRMYDDNPFACSFLLLNAGTGTPASFDLKKTNKKIHMRPQQLWVGSLEAGFDADKEYGNKQCFEQGLVLGDALTEDLGGFGGLEPIHGSTLIKNVDLNGLQRLLFKQIERAGFYKNKLQEILIEHKVLELVHASFSAKNALAVSSRDQKIAEQARQIILGDLQNPPSIKALAKMCATNEFKLKNVFKQYFNVTIYAMVQQERMKLAKTLLQANEISVREAADMVGYRSLGHFSRVFRQYYGVLPSELSRAKKVVPMLRAGLKNNLP